MAIAVIGAGNIGKTLTGLLSKAGEPVAIAASRVPTLPWNASSPPPGSTLCAPAEWMPRSTGESAVMAASA